MKTSTAVLASILPASGAASGRPAPPPARVERSTRRLESFLQEQLDGLAGLPDGARVLVPGGKHLRSRILFATAAQCAAEAQARLLRAAAAVEMIHAGSLLHDDIVDGAETRRGLPVVHRRHGLRAAVDSGSLVMSMAAALFACLPQHARLRVAETARQAALGQLLELAHIGDRQMTASRRLRIMSGKTAVVFRLAAELGASLSGRTPAEVMRSARVGHQFGLLFQIVDDVEDLCAPMADLGRRPGEDVRAGVMTLPLVFALDGHAAAGWERITACAHAIEDDSGAGVLVEMLGRTGALRRTARVAGQLHDQGVAALDGLEEAPWTVWLRHLFDLLKVQIDARLEVAHG